MSAESASGGDSRAGGASADAKPDLMCDIVMKGGITSGVVYPGAILGLARRYRFKSIGGTSAGAIAAAVLAAAEHARCNGSDDGFKVIERLPGELGGGTVKKPFMLQLFQADVTTRTLFAALLGFTRHGRLLATLGLLVAFWRATLMAVIVTIGFVLVGGADVASVIGGIALGIVVLAIGLVVEILRALRAVAANDLGMCRLGPEVGSAAKPALTAWLHARIQQAAGLPEEGPPLTFADLWGAPPATGPASGDKDRLDDLLDRSRNPDSRIVDLQMMTTDLTQGRPVRLPIRYDRHEERLEDGAGTLLFDRDELARFFPAPVVAHLELCAEPHGSTADAVARFERDVLGHDGPRPRLLRMPIGPDLPVIVATRMSLSFPLLISAVPLWRLRPDEEPMALQRVIFSDGGITSNFPIHFFDSPLPTRPTFGLRLVEAPDPDLDPGDASQWVDLPRPPSSATPEPARDVANLTDFADALKDAAQNWRDNAQARLPGFRDRIARIRLGEGEGGLNLTMDPEVIRRLNDRGTVAGEGLRRCFSGDALEPQRTDQWNDHRFTRYRVTMAVMDRLLRSYHRGYTASGDAATKPYPELVVAGEQDPPYPFGSERRRIVAEAASRAYVDMVQGWDDEHLDDANVPRPPATMRTVPPV